MGGTGDFDNYDNETVQVIKEQMGDFDYASNPMKRDGTRREERPEILLENRAKYEGEWNVQESTKDGRGK
jgi:hypothetical protein